MYMHDQPKRKYDWLNAWTIAALPGPVFIIVGIAAINIGISSLGRPITFAIPISLFITAYVYINLKTRVPVYGASRKALQVALNIFMTFVSLWIFAVALAWSSFQTNR